MKKKVPIRQMITQYGVGIFLAILLILIFLPVWSAVIVSISTGLESLKSTVYFWPKEGISFEGYELVFIKVRLMSPLLNSLYVTILGTAFHTLMCTLLGYTLSQKQVAGIKGIVSFVIIMMTIPTQAIMLPQYMLFRHLDLINNLNALIIYNLVTGFSVLLMRNYFEAIPKEMREATEIDGGNPWQIFYKIYMPMAVPGLVTIIIFQAVERWNQYTAAILFITDQKLYTIQQALAAIINFDDSTSSGFVISPNIQMAGIVVGLIPLVVLYLVLQRFFKKGIHVGAIK